MKFSTEYSKLKKQKFTTIRKNRGYYHIGDTFLVNTPEQRFVVQVVGMYPITKSEITDNLALDDADCTANQLREKLEGWYGKKYDNFILISLEKV